MMNEFEQVEFIKHDIASLKEWVSNKQDSIKQIESEIECISGRICVQEIALQDAEKKLHDREHVAHLNRQLDYRMIRSIYEK
jgi:hypothetical protein